MIFRALILTLCVMAMTPLAAQETAPPATTLTLLTHDSFDISPELLADFAAETGIELRILRGGDTGTMVTQAILSADDPLADLLFGIDNTFLSRALEADLFLPYESPLLEAVPPAFLLEDETRVTPIDYGDVCLNYDRAYFEENALALPETLADPDERRISRPAGSPEPGHLFARPGLPAGDGRRLRRGWRIRLSRFLARAGGQRRAHHRGLDGRLFWRIHGPAAKPARGRWSSATPAARLSPSMKRRAKRRRAASSRRIPASARWNMLAFCGVASR